MVDYSVERFVTDRLNSVEEANKALGEYLNTVDSSKVVRLVKIVRVGTLYEGVVIHDK